MTDKVNHPWDMFDGLTDDVMRTEPTTSSPQNDTGETCNGGLPRPEKPPEVTPTTITIDGPNAIEALTELVGVSTKDAVKIAVMTIRYFLEGDDL